METKRVGFWITLILVVAVVSLAVVVTRGEQRADAQSFPTATPDPLLQATPTPVALPTVTAAPTPEFPIPTKYGESPDGMTYFFYLYNKSTNTWTFYTLDRRNGLVANFVVLSERNMSVLPGGFIPAGQ